MTIPRRDQIDPTLPTWVHATSRCVRRAFLAGDQYEHRKAWIEDRMRLVASCFAAEVAGFAVMSNHVHVIVIPILNQLSTNQVKFPLLIQFTYVRNSILGVMLCVHVIHFLITRRPSRCV